MSEDYLRARLDRIDRRIEDRLNITDRKLDELRRELQDNSAKTQARNSEAHGKIYERMEALENEAAENRHVIAAMKEHVAGDVPFEAGWRQKAYQVMLFVLTSAAGAFAAILTARWTR